MAVPPDFVAGQVLTAAQMNKIGLWLVKTQTIGTAVSSVTVTDAFNADFENYKIVVSGGVGSTDINLLTTLGASATTYYWGQVVSLYSTGAVAGANGSNTTSWRTGVATANAIQMNVDLLQPNVAKFTGMQGLIAGIGTTWTGSAVGGYHGTATAYTGFTITTSTGTLTGGTIYVYGYRD